MSQTETPESATRRWPTGTEYAESVQQPQKSFSDAELKGGSLTLTPLGLPAMASGQNAVAFHFEAPDRAVAVRCLLSAHEDGRVRYTALQHHLESAEVPGVVPARWIEEGIRAHGSWWPIVVMPWATGRPLHDAVEDRIGDGEALDRLADRWFDLIEDFQSRQFAHGDLQHGNVLLTDEDEFQFVDLDGIWVPGLDVGAPDEYGHPNYQHARRGAADWDVNVDTFSAIAIGLSLRALAVDPGLGRFMTGENLLFARPDFVNVTGGEIWRALKASSSEQVRDLTDRLISFATADRPPGMALADARTVDVSTLRTAAPSGAALADGGLPTVGATTSGDGWWSGGGVPATGSADSYWGDDSGALDRPPATVGMTGTSSIPAMPAPAIGSGRAQGRGSGSTGLARITGRPLLAGIVSGLSAGVIGGVLAGIAQGIVDDQKADAALFVGLIAALLAGFINAWPALNLKAYGTASLRFLFGLAAGAIAGIVAVVIADRLIKAVLEPGVVQENAGLVIFIWAVTAALIGLTVGAMRSFTAASLGFAGGALGGALGGVLHGATFAEFDNRTLVLEASNPGVLVLGTVVSSMIGFTIALAMRTARSGSLAVTEGTGAGTTIDFHGKKVSIGGSSSDTLVISGVNLPAGAVRIRLGDTGAVATAGIPVVVDGVVQSDSEFPLRSGQVLAVGGVFIRFELPNDRGQ